MISAPEISILLDGWPLVFEPNGPAAIHLQALFDHLPEGIRTYAALPKVENSLNQATLPPGISAVIRHSGSRTNWEQFALPAIAREMKIDLLHLVGSNPALLGAGNSLISPAGYPPERLTSTSRAWQPARPDGVAARWRQALAVGGQARAMGFAWPEDLPALPADRPTFKLPPVVPAPFWLADTQSGNVAGADLPDSYILYHGPLAEADLRRLLDAWSWAAGAIGEYFPLVVLGGVSQDVEVLTRLCDEYQTAETVRGVSIASLGELAQCYRSSTAIFHPAVESVWGGTLRLALACGKPVVALETPLADALVGPAAYLVKPRDSYLATCRALGAALVSVVVEDQIAEALIEAARTRSALWRQSASRFAAELQKLYRILCQIDNSV